jgi:hypothetical protein
MKKLILFLLSVCSLVLTAKAQPVIEWQKAYGGSYNERIHDIKRTEDSGFIVLASAESFDGDVITSRTNITPDIWVLKLDKTGQIQWSRTYGGSADEQGASIEITDRGYVFAGSTVSTDGDVSYNHGLSDVWMVSIDNSGNILWEKTYGGPGYDGPNMLRKNADSSFILIGVADSMGGDISSTHGMGDIWVVKISKTGVLVWEKTIGGSAGESGKCIEQTTDGGYIAGAVSFSNDGDVPNNKGQSDIWLFKLNSSGTITWKKNYGGSNGEPPQMVHQTKDGGYIVSGYTISSDGDISGFHTGSGPNAASKSDIWIFKTNASGNISWAKTLGGSGNDINYDIKELNDGYLVAGYATSTDGDVTGLHSVNQPDAWLCKLDVSGSLVWQKTYGTSMGDGAARLLMENDSSFLFAGAITAGDYDATGCNFHGSGFSDIWLVKLGSPLSVHDIDKSQSISVYPTITSGAVNIELPQAYEALSFAVTDITGRKASASISGNGAKRILTFDANTAAGLYILQVKTAHGSYSYKLVYEP